jgi:hypothetical protein
LTAFHAVRYRRSPVRHRRIVLTALLVAAFAAPADATLCLRKGRITFRPGACKKREAQVAGDRVGAVGPAGAPGGPGAAGPRGIRGGLLLFSGDGRVMGTWLHGFDDVALITSPVDGAVLFVGNVQATGVMNGEPTVYHEDETCQGAPFARSSGILVEEGQFYDGVVYQPAVDAGASRTVRSRSVLRPPPCATPASLPGFCCSKLPAAEVRIVAPVRTFELSRVGVPPFRVGR